MAAERTLTRREREALDPEATAERLLQLLGEVPERVLENPALPVLELTHPALALEAARQRANALWIELRERVAALSPGQAHAFAAACSGRAAQAKGDGAASAQRALRAAEAGDAVGAALHAAEAAARQGPGAVDPQRLLVERRWQLGRLDELLAGGAP